MRGVQLLRQNGACTKDEQKTELATCNTLGISPGGL